MRPAPVVQLELVEAMASHLLEGASRALSKLVALHLVNLAVRRIHILLHAGKLIEVCELSKAGHGVLLSLAHICHLKLTTHDLALDFVDVICVVQHFFLGVFSNQRPHCLIVYHWEQLVLYGVQL